MSVFVEFHEYRGFIQNGDDVDLALGRGRDLSAVKQMPFRGQRASYPGVVAVDIVKYDVGRERSGRVREEDDRICVHPYNALPYEWTLTDMTGKTIQAGKADGDITIDTRYCATGLYLLRLNGDGISDTRKVMIR